MIDLFLFTRVTLLRVFSFKLFTQVRWSHRQDHRRRHLAQVFIKGDNIVMVSLTVNPEAPLTRVDPEARGKAAG